MLRERNVRRTIISINSILSIISIEIILLTFSFLLVNEVQGQERDIVSGVNKPKVGLQLLGGYGYLSIGDWNSYSAANTKMQKDLAQLFSYEASGDFQQLNGVGVVGGAVRMSLTPRLNIFFAFSLLGQKQSSDENKIVVHRLVFSETMSHNTQIRVIPLELGAIYSIPVFSRINLCFNLAGGYYWARLNDFFRRDMDGLWEEIRQKVQGSAFGLRGGIGLEYKFSKQVSLLADFVGRLVSINQLRGNYDYKNSSGWVDYYKGNLYYYETDLTWMGLGVYPQMKVFASQPDPNIYKNNRLGRLNLNGFCLLVSLCFWL